MKGSVIHFNMIEESFNFIYSLLESAKYMVLLSTADFQVRRDLSLLVVTIDTNVITFEMYNGHIETIWFDGEICPFERSLNYKLLTLMKE